jgi:hypothetical protein
MASNLKRMFIRAPPFEAEPGPPPRRTNLPTSAPGDTAIDCTRIGYRSMAAATGKSTP